MTTNNSSTYVSIIIIVVVVGSSILAKMECSVRFYDEMTVFVINIIYLCYYTFMQLSCNISSYFV